jgi:hypothetical protein
MNDLRGEDEVAFNGSNRRPELPTANVRLESPAQG